MMQSHSEDHHQSVNNRGEINPSIVNTHQRLDNEINEIGQDQNIEQDKIIHQLIQSNKSGKINQQPSVTQISAAASFFTRKLPVEVCTWILFNCKIHLLFDIFELFRKHIYRSNTTLDSV
ncbi:unnamed protein product [Schistosoma curassoni]|uniref:Uncharacterized protein n=1 Tax=Schistosoma curassoni TaxID=6186 RepID=A0A183KCY2_9TREM|nr:unnamed protein product [Schistosoma curassoni]